MLFKLTPTFWPTAKKLAITEEQRGNLAGKLPSVGSLLRSGLHLV